MNVPDFLARLIYRILYLYNLLQGRKNSEIELVSMEEKAAYAMIKIKRGERVHGKNSDFTYE
ncbi:hypothetical protein FBF65_11930 [Enterococcus faecium]|nr:hypothetical protein FBF65_11930 [Enterococcus faecium]